MNYSSINSDSFDNGDTSSYTLICDDTTDKSNINDLNANLLLQDYKKLNETFNNNKNKLKELEKRKDDSHSYKCSIYLKHQDAMLNLHKDTELNEDGILLNDTIINYIELIKAYYDKWISEYYNPLKNKLTSDINDNELKLIAYRKLFIKTTNEIINNEKISKNMCPICFENEINMCAIPCGHTCCNECVLQAHNFNNNRKKCLNCRNNIKEYIKIYFSL
jgi:hypothetical protein|uniref:RING-type domain-containing protein n=1 Tax=viral metagenome TaxID=1070528 RepID=A0A6C0DKW7_9ZZZZ